VRNDPAIRNNHLLPAVGGTGFNFEDNRIVVATTVDSGIIADSAFHLRGDLRKRLALYREYVAGALS